MSNNWRVYQYPFSIFFSNLLAYSFRINFLPASCITLVVAKWRLFNTVLLLDQRSTNFFSKEPVSKRFRLSGPYMLSVAYDFFLLFFKNVKNIPSSQTAQKQDAAGFRPQAVICRHLF